MENTNSNIIKYIKQNRRGKIFFADEFRKFGSNEAVRQALSRLCKRIFLCGFRRGFIFIRKSTVKLV